MVIDDNGAPHYLMFLELEGKNNVSLTEEEKNMVS